LIPVQFQFLIIVITFVFFAFTALIVRMTFQAGEFYHRRRMACTASCASMIDTCPFFINARLWM
jgi:hypothetical protein